ncbi:extensin-like [Limulus polyphemus]|uniref:Extensin-like n=1 Tax=Limulus polyphemus TaxID=6850 RepID=A0ABM1T690_LIMPO|nr:extensin-like [Limulus polyphemus]XP_022251395.1 extensin-like [Limulus polyphemus]XP_022251396.1 extensin-like [Limulus polyphemus]XP_022251397.1 extensin-like [Limulus polyphemus]
MKPVSAFCCFCLVGAAVLTSASENEAEDFLVESASEPAFISSFAPESQSSSYMVAYPIEEKTPEDDEDVEPAKKSVLSKLQDKDKIDETLLLFLPSEKETSLNRNNEKETMITGIIQTIKTIIQKLPILWRAKNKTDFFKDKQPKEENIRNILDSRPQSFPFFQIPKSVAKEKSASLQLPSFYLKSSPKLQQPYIKNSSRHHTTPRALEQPEITEPTASLLLKKALILGNGIEDGRMHGHFDGSDYIAQVVNSGHNIKVNAQLPPHSLQPEYTSLNFLKEQENEPIIVPLPSEYDERPTPFHYNQKPLLHYPMLSPRSRTTGRPFSFSYPQASLATHPVPQFLMTPNDFIAPSIPKPSRMLMTHPLPHLLAPQPFTVAPLPSPNPYTVSSIGPLERVMILLHSFHVPMPVPIHPQAPMPLIHPSSFAVSAPSPLSLSQFIYDYSPMETDMEEPIYIPRQPLSIPQQNPQFIKPPIPISSQYFPLTEMAEFTSTPAPYFYEPAIQSEALFVPMASSPHFTRQQILPSHSLQLRYAPLPLLQEQENERITVQLPNEYSEEPMHEPIPAEKPYSMSIQYNDPEQEIASLFSHPYGLIAQILPTLKQQTVKKEPSLVMIIYDDDQKSPSPQPKPIFEENEHVSKLFPRTESFNKMKLFRENIIQKQAILTGIRYNEPKKKQQKKNSLLH